MSKVRARTVRSVSLFIFAAAILSAAPAQAITACGNVLASTTWTVADSPVTLTCDVIVYPGVTLTIAPGVTVKGAANVSLNIRGTLSAIGTTSNPITLTTTSVPTKWGGIAFATSSGGSGTIQYATVSYANAGTSVQCCYGVIQPATILDSTYSNNQTAVSGYAGSIIEIRRSTFSNNTQALDTADKRVYDSVFSGNGCGLCGVERTEVYGSTFNANGTAISGTNGTKVLNSMITNNTTGVITPYNNGPELHRDTITGNGTGILLPSYGAASPITYNNIHSNTISNVRTQGASNQSLPNNYWGTTSTPAIDAGIYDGLDQAGLGLVVYSPILSLAVTQDLTPPDTIITSAPSNPSNAATAVFAFTSTESPSTFACALDYAQFTTCTTPVSYSGLSDGAHTFKVRATDNDMNTDASPATTAWTVDTTAPDTSFISGPTGTGTPSNAKFVFQSSDGGATFRCALDDASPSACASPLYLTGLDDGRHVFEVSAVDTAGNIDPSPAKRVWSVDAVAPSVRFIQPVPPGTYVNGTPVAAGTDVPVVVGPLEVIVRASDAGSGISSFALTVDGVAVPFTQSGDTYSFVLQGYTPGMHDLAARAVDGVGLTTDVSQLIIGAST